jgi:hypothetical protein
MQRREVSETADPQKARFRWVRAGRPSASTSVAVSERAQQNDLNILARFRKSDCLRRL